MYRRNKAFLTLFLSLAVVNLSFFSSIPERAVAQDEFRTYPSTVTVTRGAESGAVPLDVSSSDGRLFTVVEEDTGSATEFQNDTILPIADGGLIEMPTTNACFQHFDCVNEGPPSPGDGDVTWVGGALNAGDPGNDTYRVADYTLDPGLSIDEVRVFGTARKTTGAPDGEVYHICVGSNVTLACGTANMLTISYINFTETFTTDPDTGLAWTESGVDNMDMGHRIAFMNTSPPPSVEMRATVLWATVQSSVIGSVDFTADYQFTFNGIKGKEKPVLEISGFRTGDTEAITVQALRAGTFVTISSDVFDTSQTTRKIALSTTDIVGGTATIRILDSDITDDTQTTISIDEILILTEEQPGGPGVPIRVFTQSEYRSFENRLLVRLFWTQSGGPEEGQATDKWVTVSIDGVVVPPGFFRVKDDHTFVPVPWGAFDGDIHNGTVKGFVQINWTRGPITYGSVPEDIVLDNSLRFLIILTVTMVIVILILLWVANRLNENRKANQALERELQKR